MKILVVGAGAIGGYYGARLLQAGGDVTFLVRPRRAALLASDGLQVRSALGDFDGPVATVTRESLKPEYDLVVLSCKAYDLEATLEDIGPAMAGRAAVLPFLNGLSVYDRLDELFGHDRVLGGVAYIAVTLDPQGVIRHLGDADVVVTGSRSAASASIAQAFHALIEQSPGARNLSPNVEHALWNKWVMLASGAMMTCLMRGTVGEILATRDGTALMKQAMAECRAVAAAEGVCLTTDDVQRLEARLLDTQSTWAASMMRDIAQDAPRIEAEAIVGNMLERAERHGVEATLLRTAYCHLQVYERKRVGAP
ncbi:ketopantoate reductase family protein [Xanthomonas hortorum]|uniref:2-dehydropantoate 2-reductase n=1 Tax=Xanthomonas hortorum pv. hederae TaxID=453603 RepID=A0A9X3YZV1_9XANT|nr:2-dehydropantoate 2-reductase [Xanthomonas hortorum]MCE4370747.1 2-dehydropantoate 2-reductase [Xanthomonas hortorum pv. hederae]MDC8637573.1 2-dehydropantoate 2-reductase [Xanthomonas hortorum pv. hederae]PPU83654.1 2-dehydropantoate 2-reductase [Xanthomonas hortorum pv. hederae]PUF00811.1 2-dehydropantoate 2-reductase [Xanthomonas hortorum pv. hederae]